MSINTNEKAAGACNANGPHNFTNGVNFPNGDTFDQAPDRKAVVNQVARLQLAGQHVIEGAAGDFTCGKYGLTRYCSDYAELAEFAKKLGVDHE